MLQQDSLTVHEQTLLPETKNSQLSGIISRYNISNIVSNYIIIVKAESNTSEIFEPVAADEQQFQ